MSKPAPFPHRYTVALAGGQLSAAPRAPITLGPPPQFGGSDSSWSPEELLVGAVLECLWTTFDAYARHDGLDVLGFGGTGVAVLDKGKPGPMFTSITLSVTVTVAPADREHAKALLATAEQRCIISNALRVPISVEANIESSQAA